MKTVHVSSTSRSALVLLMLCCLLAAQWLGLGHRIAHAGWQLAGPAQVVKAGAADSGRQSPTGDPIHAIARSNRFGQRSATDEIVPRRT